MTFLYRVEMLGGLQVRHEDRLITRFRTRKTGELLAYLACDPTRMHPREMLVELLFPELDPSARLGNLSKSVSFLRSQFETTGKSAGSLIRADRHSVGLNVQSVATDVAAFETCLLEAQHAVSDLTRTQALSDAATHYRGPLLPEFYSDWVLTLRERLVQQHLHALRTLVRLLAKTGETRRALEAAQQAVQADPLLEETHTDLMRLYVAVGQPEMAVRQYRELEQRLSRELDIQPSSRARQLLAQLQEPLKAAPSSERTSETVTIQEPHGTPPIRPMERADDRLLYTAAPPPTSGTITFLLVDLTSGARTETGVPCATISDELSRRLRAELRRHGGGQLRADPGLLVAAFGRASDAGYGALAIRALFSREEPTAQPRLALDTREVRTKDGEDVSRLLELGLRLMNTAHEGQILCDEATAALLNRELSPILQVEPLGSYRLQEGTASCRLFQLQDRDMPRSFPALRAPSGDPVHLPSMPTRFFGREEELQRLRALLEDPEVRLITLMGPGGIGKTRLAREAAAHAAETAGLAVWWADLTDLTAADRLPDALLTTLHLPLSPGHSALELLIEAIRKQPMLLVLDNFEQLVEEGAGIVGQLIAQTTNLKLLVTSRQTLELSAEWRLELLPLPVPIQGVGHRVPVVVEEPRPAPGSQRQARAPQSSPPNSLLSVPSVALFVDRVQSLRLDFRLGRHNAEAIALLCARLEGIPLAIELAAARAQLLTPSQMLAQLEDRFTFLVSRKRDMPSRHRTLLATLEWSTRLLSPELQRFLSRLSVFRGGWTIEAAAEVCGESGDILRSLEALCNSSLIVVEENEESTIRFRMLETVREYAAEQHDQAANAPELFQRHYDHYARLAHEFVIALAGPRQKQLLSVLDAEHDNVRAALRWALSSEIAEIGLALAGDMARFWQIRGQFKEGQGWLEQALAQDETPGSARSEAMRWLGWLHHRQGDEETAKEWTQAALALARRIGDLEAIAPALRNLGAICSVPGEHEFSRACVEEALAIDRRTGDSVGLAWNLHILGNVAWAQQDYPEAKRLWSESAEVSRSMGNQYGLANTLDNLVTWEKIHGGRDAARRLNAEATVIMKELNEPGGIAGCAQQEAHLLFMEGKFRDARSLFRQSLSTLHQLDLQGTMMPTLVSISACMIELGEVETGIRLLASVKSVFGRTQHWMPEQVRAIEDNLTEGRQRLSSEAFERAWQEGTALSLEEAIQQALQSDDADR